MEVTQERMTKDLFVKDVSTKEDQRTFTATMTNDAVDRDGEVVWGPGLSVKDFLKNPIILHNHDTNQEVGHITRITPVNEGREWEVDGQIMPKGSTVAADETWAKIKNGVLRALSIGFIGYQFRVPTPRDIAIWGKKLRRVITRSSLVEVSLVATPSNPNATISSFKNFEGNTEEVAEKDIEIEESPTVVIEETVEDTKDFDILVAKIKKNLVEQYAEEKEQEQIKEYVKEQVIMSELFKNGLIYY